MNSFNTRLDHLPVMSQAVSTTTSHESDDRGHWGNFGGQYVPESLMSIVDEVSAAYSAARKDPAFLQQLDELQRHYTGRPSPVYFASRFSERVGAQVYLKREDLNHTGSHKINNVLGQVLLATRMGKTRVIAETGAGQHGVATATACALLGVECCIYMGAVDAQRQALNVARMKLLGAEVIEVSLGSATLKDAINEAMRDWVAHTESTYYAFGTAAGPHPFPSMVRDFQRIVGMEARQQMLDITGELPDIVMACVGGGSNAIGIFHPFLTDDSVRFIGCEAAGNGVESGKHAATITAGRPGVFQGSLAHLLQDDDGQAFESHSISAGLDYPGVGPEHSSLQESGRAHYMPVTDAQAMNAFKLLCETEGIIPAIESSHALGGVVALAGQVNTGDKILVNLSGRGDKDVDTAGRYFGLLPQ